MHSHTRVGRQAAVVLALALPSLGLAQVSLEHDRDVYTFDHPQFQIQVDAAAGGRIRSWVLKKSGKELVALWKSGQEIGGILDDRAFFTAARYEAAIMRPGPAEAVLRLEAKHPSGLDIVKVLTATTDSPTLRISYQYSNGTQAPTTLWVRNFPLPGTQPQTDSHLYWVNGVGVRGGKTMRGAPDASGYYAAAKPEYAALWDKATGDGLYVYAPGVERFYFWRGSTVNPTFEWIYPELPAGQVLFAQCLIGVVSGEAAQPVWQELIERDAGTVRNTRTIELKDWVDEATKFAVTQAERDEGFWLSLGRDEGKQRLPAALPVDLARNDDRYLAVTLNLLKDMEAPVRVGAPEAWRQQVSVFWETPGDDRRELLPIPIEAVPLKSGEQEQLWLRVSSEGKPDGEHAVPLMLHVGDVAKPLRLELHVWPVDLEGERPFHVRGYCGGYTVWTGGYEVTEDRLQRLDAILATFADIGGDVLDWNCVWARLMPNIRIAETGESLAEVAKTRPEEIDLANLPKLDFSHFDPWLEAAKKHGVTRVETYMPHPNHPQLGWRLLAPAVGKGRVEIGSPEARRVLVWFFAEMKRWFESHGFTGFFAKVSDEISPEYIPTYLEVAPVAREAGWRPFTTITGMIARTAALLEQMDPQCDEWQLSFGLKDDFLALLEKKYELVQRRIALDGAWGPYHNGGAKETWGKHVFGEGGAAGLDAGDVESFELLEDGKPLKHKGGSPWGNTEHGIVCTAGSLKTHLYLSAFDGGDPKDHKYELVVKVRRESPAGRPLVTIDETDEVWCYGGSSRPFRRPYETTWPYPLMTLYHGFRGYGLWAFLHWNKTENIVWVDPETKAVTVSPAYCGYRDGWRDALVFDRLTRIRGREALAPILGEAEDAILRVGKKSREVYNFRTLLNAGDPLARNRARAEALQALSNSR